MDKLISKILWFKNIFNIILVKKKLIHQLLFFCLFDLFIYVLFFNTIYHLNSAIKIVFLLLSILIFLSIFLKFLFIDNIKKKISDMENIIKRLSQNNEEIKIYSKNEIENLYHLINDAVFKIKASEKIKNDSIASMSHELRTPLTAIRGWAETMKTGDEIDFSTVRRGLDIIIKETRRLSNLVERILDFSSFESKTPELIKEKIDLLAEVGEAVCIFREKAIFDKKTLIYNEPKSISPVIGDKDRLRQVFVNIIDNALKFSNEKSSVNVSVSEYNNNVFVKTTDTGCGISKSEISKITNKFYKANSSYVGSGIGLAIVKEIVEACNGKLEILSEENFGTTVTVSFPIYSEPK
ncbi:MAG: HAMP domain-containing histidine kinase [Oscillospiraceae bacterium]|jgi:signal transduction histidine kinase|nr:HAMP domain-containing histidine kinase [Oscillospiraceae bacterium]